MMFPRCTFTIAAAALLATPLPEKGVRTIFPASGPATSIRQLELLCSPLQITLEGLRAFAWADGALAALAEPPPVVEKIAPAKPGRQYVDFDFDWRFQRGDNPTGFDPELDDTAWRVVQLPHDWSIEGPFGPEYASGTGYAPGGIAWYRKRFMLSPDLEGRQLAVEFDGVYENAEVWINGQLVGRRPYGYSSFQFDLTPYLDFAGENVLAVRVDHSKNADSRWYTGSGIYRHVRLRITDPLAVAHWGTFVTTPQVSDERATVAAETSVDNRHDRRRKVTFRWTILDPNGNQAAATTADATIDANSTANIHTELAIDNPARWSIDSPALYTLRTEVLDGAVPVDSTDTRFGIRTIRFDPDHGFFLNGQNLKLKGVCLHHDAGCLGAAVPAKVLERRLRLMKELGANAIRTSHNPPAPELLDACDRLGLLVQDEAFDEFTPPKNKWIRGRNVGRPARFGYGEYFHEWAQRDVQDMVRRDRNHPSIIMWSIGNEIDYPNDPFTHPVLGDEFRKTQPRAEQLVGPGKQLVQAVKQLDTTRPVTAALAQLHMTNEVGFPELLDVVGYNYQENRYAEDHQRFPRRIIYGSENGDAYGAWRAVTQNDYIAGQFLWTGIDHLGEAGPWPARISPAGLVDVAGFKKPDAWWRQALWSDKPLVYLAAREPRNGDRPPSRRFRGWPGRERQEHWNWKEASPVRVDCCTNCPLVDLYLNGTLIKTLTSDDERQGWRTTELDFQPGTLEAVGRDGQQQLCRFALHTAGPPRRVQLQTDAAELAADGHDVAQLTIAIVDEHGIRVPDAENEVTFTVEGPVNLLGIDNGRIAGAVDYQDNRCDAYRGRGLAIVRSQRHPGTATIRASAAGLEPAELSITVK